MLVRIPHEIKPPVDQPLEFTRGHVRRWIEKIGYQGGRERNQLLRFLGDVQRVVIDDAGGPVEPSIAEIRAKTTADAARVKLRFTLPPDFIATCYPETIKHRSNLEVDMSDYEQFSGEDYRRFREINGCTQAEVAAAAGISRRELVRYETGESAIPFEIHVRLNEAITEVGIRKRGMCHEIQEFSSNVTRFSGIRFGHICARLSPPTGYARNGQHLNSLNSIKGAGAAERGPASRTQSRNQDS